MISLVEMEKIQTSNAGQQENVGVRRGARGREEIISHVSSKATSPETAAYDQFLLIHTLRVGKPGGSPGVLLCRGPRFIADFKNM